MDKICSSDCCVVRSSLSTMSQSSFNFQAVGLIETFQSLTQQDNVHRVLNLADCYRGGSLVSGKLCRWTQGWLHPTSISKHVQYFHPLIIWKLHQLKSQSFTCPNDVGELQDLVYLLLYIEDLWLANANSRTRVVSFPPFQCRVHYWDGLGVDGAKDIRHYGNKV